jgi:cytochrome c-type protein NapC
MSIEKTESISKIIVISLIGIGILIGILASFSTAVAVEHTANDKYCSSCHTMDPMIASYHEDVHGGAGKQGIKVSCVACHLPHESLAGYLFAKAKTGLHDMVAELTLDKSQIDWQEKRKHSDEFVYDSGCLSCHSNVEKMTMGNPKAFIAHKEYFMKTTTKTCTGCHENVGHKLLGNYLESKTH